MASSRRRRFIAVVGGSSAPAEVLAKAEQLGREIARSGFSLVCGGRGGVMEAACRGACLGRGSSEDCVIVGILPDTLLDAGNPYLDVVIPTGLGFARNSLVVLSGDAVIAVDGGSGTLSEIALAWQHGRPIVALMGTGGWADRLAGKALDLRRPRDKIVGIEEPKAAVDYLVALFDG